MGLKTLPKIDLHRHLEGSLRLETLLEIGQKYNLPVPTEDIELLRPYVQVTNDPHTFTAFLSKFEVLRHFYRSPETISRLVYEAVADAAADHIDYLELRFSPQALSRMEGFPLGEVTDWVIAAVDKACADFSIQVGLIITLVRHDPFEQARLVADVAFERFGRGIVGLDLAGNEVDFPSAPFAPLFREAREGGLGITVHAGEWASAAGIQEAVEALHAHRIGHGVRIMENPDVLRFMQERDVAFEVCLTSNYQTGVVSALERHPLAEMYRQGLKTTINTDDPAISNVTLTNEYELAVDVLALDYEDLRRMVLNAAAAAFLPPAEKAQLITRFEEQLPHSNSNHH